MRAIDADALVYELTEMVRHNTGEYKNGIAVARLVATDAPTIEGGSWIGADKRPKKPGKYLVYGVTMFVPDHNGEPCGCWEIKTANWSDKWGWDCKVKYWMPLPEPPMEGENE